MARIAGRKMPWLLGGMLAALLIVGGYLLLPKAYWAAIAYQNADRTLSTTSDNVAIGGYDTVAYFTEGRAVKGSTSFRADWRDAKWYFVSGTDRDLFVADPERYAPQFGGFCTLGVAEGSKWGADPKAWAIVNGRLYLDYSEVDIKELSAEAIAKAEENWRKLGAPD